MDAPPQMYWLGCTELRSGLFAVGGVNSVGGAWGCGAFGFAIDQTVVSVAPSAASQSVILPS